MADQEKEFLEKLLATFRAEAQEHLHEIVSNVVLLEQADADTKKNYVARILQELHTLKGAARAVNLDHLEKLCHAMESVFSAMNKSSRFPMANQFDLLHQAVGLAQTLLQEPTGRTHNKVVAIVARLERLSAAVAVSDSEDATVRDDSRTLHASAQSEDILAEGEDPEHNSHAGSESREHVAPDMIRVQAKNLDAIRHQVEALLSVELGLQHQLNELQLLAEHIEEQSHQVRSILLRGSSIGKGGPPGHGGLAVAGPGDLRIERRCREITVALSRTRRDFMLIRTKLMDATLDTALVPMSAAMEHLPGLVRNLARNQNKEVMLQSEGETIQIDRRVIGILREALIHLVTNAVDHGIEPVATRRSVGKRPTGCIQIKAAQQSGTQVSVMVKDDGAGIDLPRVIASAAKAIGFSDEHINRLGEQEKLRLVMQSGVSTRTEVTSVSGRGVGLAVVADKVASIGGELKIETEAGQGCVFQIVLPVRLATIRGLAVRVKNRLYVLPLYGIDSARTLKSGEVQTVEGRETIQVASRIVPVIRLGQLFRLDHTHGDEESIVLIARHGTHFFALLVDEILSEQEVLPKHLGKQLRRVRYVGGVAQLGDGQLVPVLALDDIAKYGLAAPVPARSKEDETDGTRHKRILVAEDSITSRMLLKYILESAGFEVETVADGLEAMSKLRRNRFDALVSDIEMPGLDGLALTREIRNHSTTPDMPIVLVTSLHSPEERQRGMMAGADAYVAKGSFDQENLLATIRRLV